MGAPGVSPQPLPEQAALLRELGYDGIGWELWPAAEVDARLAELDAAELPLRMVWAQVNVQPDHPQPHRPDLPGALRRLKGRPVTVALLLVGLPPGDPRGMEPAVQRLRALAEAAGEADIRLAIYNHTNDWAEKAEFAAAVAERVNHPRVGLMFNLCHWLRVEGDRDMPSFLRAHIRRVFSVSINGATLGTTEWTNGLVRPLDEGDFDNRPLLALLDEIGYRGDIGLMCYGVPGDARDHLARSMKIWRSWWRKDATSGPDQ
jgi:sugar phosphate isomerase/epimerase